MVTDHVVELRPVGRGKRGTRYEVRYCGDVLIASTADPEFNACRALLARGIKGRLTTRWAGTSVTAMTMDIEAGAKLRTSERADGLRTVAYVPLEVTAHSPALPPESGEERPEEAEALGWGSRNSFRPPLARYERTRAWHLIIRRHSFSRSDRQVRGATRNAID
jgi:hypothetical protein